MNGRSGGIRTRDPYPPRVVRYRAALRSDWGEPLASLVPKRKPRLGPTAAELGNRQNVAPEGRIALRLDTEQTSPDEVGDHHGAGHAHDPVTGRQKGRAKHEDNHGEGTG